MPQVDLLDEGHEGPGLQSSFTLTDGQGVTLVTFVLRTSDEMQVDPNKMIRTREPFKREQQRPSQTQIYFKGTLVVLVTGW